MNCNMASLLTVAVTGSSGFLGKALVSELAQRNINVVALARRATPDFKLPDSVEYRQSGDLSSETSWVKPLKGVNVIVHTAARVHLMKDGSNSWQLYYRANVEGTIELAKQAIECGVKRFVFVSSIKVNGESTNIGEAFSPSSPLFPEDEYGRSKLEAENLLKALCANSGMELVVVRPPLIYGPGVKANFLSMLKWIDKGFPLPLAAVTNARSMVSISNLVGFLMLCVEHKKAANKTFLISDGNDLSTSDTLRILSLALGRSPRLFYVPVWFLVMVAKLLGKRGVAKRLTGNLQIDISYSVSELGWTPSLSVDEGLEQVAKWYLKKQ